MKTAGSTRTRALLAFNVLLALLIMVWLADRLRPRLATDVRRDLLLDDARVELLEGFDDVAALETWNDIGRSNPDRDEVAIPMRRSARLAWHVAARRGRFLVGVARLVVGPAGDESEAVLIVQAEDGVERRVALPPAPAESAAPEGIWREGPAAELVLDLPAGAETLILQTLAPEGAPDGAAVALLSPRVIQTPAPRSPGGWSVTVPEETRLLALVPALDRDLVFALRQGPAGPDGALPEPTEELVAPVEAAGSFTVRGERPAITFTGGTPLDLTADIESATSLRGAVALDERVPPGSSAVLELRVDDEVVASERVDDSSWREIEIPLGAHLGAGRRLSLRLVERHLVAGEVTRRDIDLVTGMREKATYRARRVRVGLSAARLSTPREVTRRTASVTRPSVILIQVETLRADVLPIYGGLPADLAPNLTALARRGVTFDLAMTPSPWTVPTTASLMTGLPPSAHGAVDHDRMVLPGGVPTLAERARAAGLATGAVVASDVLRPQAGFARGFETFVHIPYSNARQVNDLAEAFLSNHVGQQFLLLLHTFDPHSPYNAPGERRDRFLDAELAGRTVRGAETRLVDALRRRETPSTDDPDVRFLRERYLGEIAWMDEQLGVLLGVVERLGIDEDTIIVFTSDHGEEFMEHGLLGHGSNLHDETLHVPLVVAAPAGVALDWARGSRVPAVVETVGLYASVLDWMGVPYDRAGARPPLERPTGFAFSETDKGVAADGRGDPLRRFLAGVRTDSHRLIHVYPVAGEAGAGRQELYDLRADPRAQHVLPAGAPGQAAIGRRLTGLLTEALAWARAHRARTPLPGGGLETYQRLIEMGYIDGSTWAEGEREPVGDTDAAPGSVEQGTPPGG